MKYKNKIRENRLFFTILLIELLFLLVLLFSCGKDKRILTMEADEWEAACDDIVLDTYEDGSHGITRTESTGIIDQEIMDSDDHHLQPGAYRVTVHYQSVTNVDQPSNSVADSAGKLVLFSYKNNTALSTSTIKLDDGANTRTSRLWVRFGKELDDFQGKILYNGQGKIAIQSVILEEVTGWRIMRIVGFLVLFIFLDGIYLLFAKNTIWQPDMEQKYTICGLGFIMIITSMLYFTDSLYYGHDLTFHLERLHAMADGFLEGQIPHRIQTNMLNGYGYANPLFYGELFLSIPALLYCLFVPLQTCYKIYAILMNCATCLISYHCFKKMSKDLRIAMFITFLYTASAYRMVDLFVRADVGEYTAMTFLPLVVYGFYQVYEKPDDEKQTMREYLPIVLGLTGILECHILSCYMLAVFIPLFVIMMWKKTFKKYRFVALVKSVVLCGLLNVWFVYPLLKSLQMNIKITQAGTSGRIEQYGVTLSQIFSIFHTATGDSIWDGTKGEMPLTVGAALTIGIFIFLYICIKRERWMLQENSDYKRARIGFVLSIIALFFASMYCPWDKIAVLHPKMDQILGTIQFSWRYLEIATMTLTVVMLFLCKVIEERCGRNVLQWFMIGITILALLTEGLFYTQYANESNYKKYFAESELTGFDVGSGMEYILRDTDTSALLVNKVVATDGTITSDMESNHGKRYISVQNQSGVEGYVDIPVLYYDHYQAKDVETNMPVPTQTGINNRIRLVIPAGYQGTIQIRYQEPRSFRIMEIISLCTLLGILVYMGGMNMVEKRKSKFEA